MPAGRPTVMTEQVILKLRECFSFGLSDARSCKVAGISEPTLYKYQVENPEFINEKETLKQDLIMKAAKTISESLDDPKNAQWLLERRDKENYSTRTESSVLRTNIEIPAASLDKETLERLEKKLDEQIGT